MTDRYHLSIQTSPHESWTVPMGWTWSDLDAAREGARRADAQWMRVRLVDGRTGRSVRYRWRR